MRSENNPSIKHDVSSITFEIFFRKHDIIMPLIDNETANNSRATW
jgi:hypothetical protein